MKIVGIFRELERNASSNVPSIYEAKGALSNEIARRVAMYLQQGEPVFDVMEFTVDPFDSAGGVSGGASLMTDGEWSWRNDLSYYVEKYGVYLPDEFVDHVLNGGIGTIDRASVVQNWKLSVDAYDAALL